MNITASLCSTGCVAVPDFTLALFMIERALQAQEMCNTIARTRKTRQSSTQSKMFQNIKIYVQTPADGSEQLLRHDNRT